MNNEVNAVVNEVAEEVVPEVVDKAVKFGLKDAGIIGGCLVGGGLAIYGAVSLTKKHIVPLFKKKDDVIDITEEAIIKDFDEAEEE